MSLLEALNQYRICQECLYVDDCPERENKILAAFSPHTTADCAADESKGEVNEK